MCGEVFVEVYAMEVQNVDILCFEHAGKRLTERGLSGVFVKQTLLPRNRDQFPLNVGTFHCDDDRPMSLVDRRLLDLSQNLFGAAHRVPVYPGEGIRHVYDRQPQRPSSCRASPANLQNEPDVMPQL